MNMNFSVPNQKECTRKITRRPSALTQKHFFYENHSKTPLRYIDEHQNTRNIHGCQVYVYVLCVVKRKEFTLVGGW